MADWYIFKFSKCWEDRRVHFQEKPPNCAPDIPMSRREHGALAVKPHKPQTQGEVNVKLTSFKSHLTQKEPKFCGLVVEPSIFKRLGSSILSKTSHTHGRMNRHHQGWWIFHPTSPGSQRWYTGQPTLDGLGRIATATYLAFIPGS